MKQVRETPHSTHRRQLWSEALWGLALIGSVFVFVAILGWFFRP
jgi:hypothetical protein